jgi:predicted GH43/DUF377 family glycosyl hydrolase
VRLHKIDSTRLSPGSMHFNAGVCLWRDKRVMAYRLEDRTSPRWAQIAMCELDADWQPIAETNKIIQIPEPAPGTNYFEDPRLYPDGDKLRMSFIAARYSGKQHVACQGFASLNENLEIENLSYPEIGTNRNYASCGDPHLTQSEKNWTLLPDLEGVLYQINPLMIYRNGQMSNQSKSAINWLHGELSGSSPLIPWGEDFLGCFHSFFCAPDGQRSYSAGWYVLDHAHERILSYSKSPILVGEYDADEKRPFGSAWVPRAVFPCGLIDLGDDVALSYGWLDSTCRLGFFSREEIAESLTPVTKWYKQKEVLHNPWCGIPGGFKVKVGNVDINARNWPTAVRLAQQRGVNHNDLMDALCLRVPKEYKRVDWVET